jgi:hypothetical protein
VNRSTDSTIEASHERKEGSCSLAAVKPEVPTSPDDRDNDGSRPPDVFRPRRSTSKFPDDMWIIHQCDAFDYGSDDEEERIEQEERHPAVPPQVK